MVPSCAVQKANDRENSKQSCSNMCLSVFWKRKETGNFISRVKRTKLPNLVATKTFHHMTLLFYNHHNNGCSVSENKQTASLFEDKQRWDEKSPKSVHYMTEDIIYTHAAKCKLTKISRFKGGKNTQIWPLKTKRGLMHPPSVRK